MAVATFGQNLKRLREEKGLTQEVLAERLGLKRSAQISLVESSPALPRPETIVIYAAALKIDPKALLQDVETDYDRIRKGLPIRSRRAAPPRKMAVGESPPSDRRSVRGRRAHSYR